jgi:hypothetical protein
VDGKLSTGLGAAVGSILGLLAGSIAGSIVFKPRVARTGGDVAKMLVPGMAGMALGAGLGAAWATPSQPVSGATGTAGLPRGLGAVSEGTKALQTEPSRYDSTRYLGKEPPHKCTVASATKIVQQIDPNWRYSTVKGGYPTDSGTDPRSSMHESSAQVTTPMGAKTIPYGASTCSVAAATAADGRPRAPCAGPKALSMDLVRWALIVFGVTLVVTLSKIAAPIRKIWPVMLHCPLCFGWWVGLFFGLTMRLGPAPSSWPLWAAGLADAFASSPATWPSKARPATSTGNPARCSGRRPP